MKSSSRKYIILLALFALFMVNIAAAGFSTCTASITNPSNAIADVGQYESFIATQSSCVSTFTYNVLVVNSITPGTITHNDLITGSSASSITYTFPTVSTDTSNSPEEANVVVTDSGANVVSSAYSSNFIIHPSLTTPAINPSSAGSYDYGQTVIFSSGWSGGTAPYSSNYIVTITNTGVQVANELYVGYYSASNPPQFAWAFPSADAGNTVQANVLVTDSASTPAMANSVKSGTITLNPALGTPTISPSNPTIDSGQSVTFTSSWTGGTPTYGASLYSSPTSTCNTQSTLVQQDIGLSSNTVTFSSLTPSASTYYCIYITDNALNSPSTTRLSSSGTNQPGQIAFSPSGTYAYMANHGSNNVIIINTASNTITGAITAGFNGPEGVAISPDGSYAYVTNQGSNNVVIINTATNTVVNSITSGFSVPQDAAFSPSGTYAYVTNCNTPCGNNIAGNVVIINTATNTVTNTMASGFKEPTGVAFSPDGSYAYVVNYYAENVVYINTATNTVINSINIGPVNLEGVSFSPSGTYAYVAYSYYAGPLGVIDTATNTITAYVPAYAGSSNPHGVAFSPSGTYAYVSTLDDGILIVNPGVETTNSVNSEVTVNPTLGIPTLTSSPSLPSTQNAGNTITFTSSWSGGTSTYTVNYLIVNSLSGNLVANMLFTGVTGTSNSFAWTISTADAGNTLQANVIITDSATTPETTNSVKSGTLTVIPAYSPPTTPTLSNCPSSTKLDIVHAKELDVPVTPVKSMFATRFPDNEFTIR